MLLSYAWGRSACVGHGSGCICKNRGEKAEFYSDREKMQGKLADFFRARRSLRVFGLRIMQARSGALPDELLALISCIFMLCML